MNQDQEAIEKIVQESNFKLAQWQNLGKTQPLDAVQIDMKMILNATKLKKQWRVVVNPGCGAAYNFAPTAAKSVGLQSDNSKRPARWNLPSTEIRAHT